MIKRIICTTLAALTVIPPLVMAQGSSLPTSRQSSATNTLDAKVVALISEAEQHFRLGEEIYKKENFEAARAEFDNAVDTILKSDLDVRSHPRLKAYFASLIEKINALETQAIARGESVNEQHYEPSLLEELAEVKLDKEDIAAGQQEIPPPDLDFPFTLTAPVRQFMHYFSENKRGRATMALGLQRSGRYLPLAREVFQEERVPLDLVWLAQAESNWRPHARSWANAQGIWQFVSWRGAQYGLRQDQWIDERSSFEQATRASARYLRFLYDRFLDWQLAMAGYNCGEGRVDRAIAATGYADFWYLYNRRVLPRETSNYVPIILAIIVIAKNPERYGFGDIKPDLPLQYDTVTVNDALDLRLVAEITNTPYEVIEELNPELKRGMTPPGMTYNLRLPLGTNEQFIAMLDRIPKDHRDSWRVAHIKEGETIASLAEQHNLSADLIGQVNKLSADADLEPGTLLVLPLEEARTPLHGRLEPVGVQIARLSMRRMSITVRPGDTISRIAARYGVSARELARLNRVSIKSRLRAGQKLILNLPETRLSRSISVSENHPTSYRVRRGDSLSGIASRYGIALSNLRKWNGLTSNKVRVGQRLVLTPQSSAKVKPTANKKVTHRVQRGDTLTSIARRYDVSVANLKTWNKLNSGKVIVGQLLTVSN
ncbi:MAG: LysM peptidoglycan-binding domain-containing protein [Acidobacteria bacterium]|nr:LysM peptidoglycan-binding domain-containing protein [Acidobacteriota bacterium]